MIEMLLARRRAWQRGGFAYRGGADLLLRHGACYRGRPLPAKHRHLVGPRNCCYRNAAEAARQGDVLRYCEGVLMDDSGRLAAHAWCLGPRGGVLEVTLPDHPRIRSWHYFGAVFAAELALEYMASVGAFSAPLLDALAELDADVRLPEGLVAIPDTRDDWPILRVPYDASRITFGLALSSSAQSGRGGDRRAAGRASEGIT